MATDTQAIKDEAKNLLETLSNKYDKEISDKDDEINDLEKTISDLENKIAEYEKETEH